MILFRYDKSFEGLLCVVFEAYTLKLFPEKLIAENEPPPLFADPVITVSSDKAKANRVWKGLEKKNDIRRTFLRHNDMAVGTSGGRYAIVPVYLQNSRFTTIYRIEFR